MAERKTHWENVYREKQPDEVSWFQEHPEKSLETIRGTEVGLNEPIIDVGGGASTPAGKLQHFAYFHLRVCSP
jgi:hypothetical protein